MRPLIVVSIVLFLSVPIPTHAQESPDLLKLSADEIDNSLNDEISFRFESELAELLNEDKSAVEAFTSQQLARRALKVNAERQALERTKARLPQSTSSFEEWAACSSHFHRIESLQNNTVLLTALRRSKHQADPLRIDVRGVPDAVEWINFRTLKETSDHGDYEKSLEELDLTLAAARSGLAEAESMLTAISPRAQRTLWHSVKRDVTAAKYEVETWEWQASMWGNVARLAPLAVESPLPDELVATRENLPSFVVRVTSADVDRVPVFFQCGGDYRSGREARWRFEVRDESGQTVPTLPMDSGFGGGISQTTRLEHGEEWATALEMSRYVKILKPGTYTVRIHYHNQVTIADLSNSDDLGRYLTFRSRPFVLNVK
jgi:hypothetical protein